MSGHLRWLAAQALGQSSGVRPARPPPSFYGMLEPSVAARDAPDPPIEETPQIERAAARPMRLAETRDASPAFAVAKVEPRGDAGIAARVPMRAPEPEDAETRQPRDDNQHPAPIVQTEREKTADDGGGDPGHATRVVVRDVIADAPHRQPARPAPRATRPGRRGAERMAPQPAAEAPSPPPDVHIHIGRVELTAIAAPQPARREPANTKKPMSLDEYLRRRSGREC